MGGRMRKLLTGVVDFHERVRPQVKDAFAQLALGQRPDAMMISCSDSRVSPDIFASTDPGDLFVVRNVGNLVPPCDQHGRSVADESEWAALEFALATLKVRHVVVCGHSECGAMLALERGGAPSELAHLEAWLRHGQGARDRLQSSPQGAPPGLARHNLLSQLNVRLQLEHLRTYPLVAERLAAGALTLHGWWFDIAEAEVSAFDAEQERFVVIDEATGPRILAGITG